MKKDFYEATYPLRIRIVFIAILVCFIAAFYINPSSSPDVEFETDEEYTEIVKVEIIEELQQKINRIEAESEKGLTTIKVLDKKSEVNSKEVTNNSKIKSIKDKDDKSKLKNNKKKVSYMIKIAARKGINEMISEIKIMNNDEKNVVRRSLLILFFIELIYIFLKRL